MKIVLAEYGLPPLPELGHDLLVTTPGRRILALSRPFVCVLAYWVCAYFAWWPGAVLAVMALFIAIVATAHDLVHQALGLPKRVNEILLSLVGMLVLESGHAYKVSHLHHHRMFPDEEDPEGDPARMSLWRALLEGPVFLYRLWWWAWRHAPAERAWLAFEGAWFCGVALAGIALVPYSPALLLYVVLVIMGSWVYPVATVYLPHDIHGKTPLEQTRTMRGRIIPALFLELTYHLEHHLYPAVPSHHYAELAQRLEPHLQRLGAKPVEVL